MKHEMFFQNPVFDEIVNVTVRKGTDWLEKTKAGDSLIIRRIGDNRIIAEGIITIRETFIAHRIPKVILNLEHDPSCRDIDGLLNALKRFYPNFKSDDIVTVIMFVIIARY